VDLFALASNFEVDQHIAEGLDAAGLFPQMNRRQRRHVDFDGTGLFHLVADPLEERNLASDPKCQAQLAALRVRCTELLRETRGEPEALPAISQRDWLNEAPAGWKDILPLLSARVKGDKETASPIKRPAETGN
jgi:hypothetical protein